MKKQITSLVLAFALAFSLISIPQTGQAESYASRVMNAYIATEITSTMTSLEKAKKITEIVARDFDYTENISGWERMVVNGGGDCWASTGFIVEACSRMGITAYAHDDFDNPLTGSLHRYALVQIGNDLYIADAGYSGDKPRKWKFRNIYSYGYYTFNFFGIKTTSVESPEYVLRDLGLDDVITIPDEIDGNRITGMIAYFNADSPNTSQYVLPRYLTAISYAAFMNNSKLSRINIPLGVKSIGMYAFSGCDALSDVYYEGSAEDAAAIQIASGNEALYRATWHYNAESAPAIATGDGWVQSGEAWYYYLNGTAVTGWNAVDGAWYYFDSNGVMRTGWVNPGDGWYYMDASGRMVTGWVLDQDKYYYMGSTGKMAIGWMQSGDRWYYLLPSGEMATGWQLIQGSYYFLEESGSMHTGWLRDEGEWYYLSSDGAMKTGWLQSGGAYYYLKSDGTLATGWFQNEGNWYWANTDGSIVTDWQEIDGQWELFSDSGVWLGSY